MKKSYLLVLAGLLLFTIVGCNTIKGIGNDISTVGHWMIKGSDNVNKGSSS